MTTEITSSDVIVPRHVEMILPPGTEPRQGRAKPAAPAIRDKKTANRRPLQMVAEDVEKIEKLRRDVWDGGLRGFGIRVSKGARSWAVMYRLDGKLRRATIGNALVMPYVDARAKAVEMLGKAARGEDPKVEAPKAEVVTVRAAFERYLNARIRGDGRRRPLRPRTAQGKRETFERDVLPFVGARQIASLRKADHVALVDRVDGRGAPVAANRLHTALCAFFNWCVTKDLLSVSPAVGAEKPNPETSRSRALDKNVVELAAKDEIRWYWGACDAIGKPWGPFYKLLLITGQRRDELRWARVSEVRIAERVWVIPAERVKNDQDHVVALSDLAVEVFKEVIGARADGLIFPAEFRRNKDAKDEAPMSGLSKAKRRLDAAMAKIAGRDIEHFVGHDMRRTIVSEMAAIGVPPHIADKVLSHKSGAIKGVMAIYQRYEFAEEQREALMRWGERLAAIVGENVVEIRARP